MPKYIVNAVLTKTYEIEVEAADAASAIATLDDWIADDFEDYETSAQWIMEA
jgi:hypothetical protein